MHWQVRLMGDLLDLQELEKSLKDSSPLKIVKDQEGYYLISSEFQDNDNESDVRIKAIDILILINGSIKLALDSRKPVKIADITKIRDDGKKETFIEVIDHMLVRDSLSITIDHQTGKIEEYNPADSVSTWLGLAQRDQNVSKALRYLAVGAGDWISLYHIYEIIRDDLGGDNQIAQKGYASKTSLSRFSRTANSPSATQETARHAVEHTIPPTNPMSLAEARTFIKALLHVWFHDKNHNMKNPTS